MNKTKKQTYEKSINKSAKYTMSLLKEVANTIKAEKSTMDRPNTSKVINNVRTNQENFMLQLFVEDRIEYDKAFDEIELFARRLDKLLRLLDSRRYRYNS